MAAGTRVGTGYVSIQPDFSGFQEKVAKRLNETLGPAFDRAGSNASKRLGRSIGNDTSLRSSLQPLLKRFQKFGDDAGEQIASRIGSGAKRSQGDMFGLAGAVKEVGRQSKSTSTISKALAHDTFGIARAATAAGKGYQIGRSSLGDWNREAHAAESVGKRLSKGITSLFSDFRDVGRNLKAASGGFGNFEGIMARANRGFQFFRNILGSLKIPALVAGVALFAQSLSALAAGAVAVTSALAPLSGALVALPAAALAGAQAFGVLKLAMMGVGNAVKAAVAVQVQGGEQATQTLRQQENAAEALADAHRTLESSERDAKYAQEDLTKARKEATRQLQDMRIASEESGLTEREGALALREARRELNKTLRDPSASGLDVQGAEQAVEQAKFSLEETRLDAKRARSDYAEAQKKGVKGMPEVVSAKRALADANLSVAAAERGVAKAVRENSDAMKQQGSAATALQQKMAELTPTGRKFARFLISLKPQFDSLREAAAKGLFPGAEKGLKSTLGNLGVVKKIVRETSGALGKLAAKAGAKLGSKAWGRDLGKVGEMNTRILTRAGDAALNFGDALRNILVSAEPLVEWMSKGTLKLSEWVKTAAQAGRESGTLGHFFDETREAMEKVWRILKPLGEGLLNVGHAAKPLGNEILDSLGKAAEGWAKWTSSIEGQNQLKNYFKEVKPAIYAIGRFVRDLTNDFFDLGRQKGVATLVEALRTTLLPAVKSVSGATTGWLSDFLNRIKSLHKKGVPAFDAFLVVLAEHAGEAGAAIAKALVRAFLNSDIWGKLAIGGWLFAKFGGGKAFESMGAKFGKRFATAFLLAVLSTELAKQIKQIIEGTKLDAPKSEEFAKYLEEYFEVDTAQIVAPNRVRISTTLGKILFNSQTEKVIAVSNKKLSDLVGQIPEQFITKFNEMSRLGKVFRNNLAPLPGIAGKSGTDLKRALLPKLDDLIRGGETKADAFKRKVGGHFQDLVVITSQAMKAIGLDVERMLAALNLPKPKGFNVAKALRELPELKPIGRQKGGPVPAFATGGLASVVPGTGTGDRHTLSLNGRPVAKVESREGIFVGNRNLMETLSAANAAVPRFQKGGQLGPEPIIAGPSGALRAIGQGAVKQVYEGAKDFLAKMKPKGVGGSMGAIDLSGISGSVASQAAQIVKRAGSPFRSTLALFEALWAESSMGSASPGNVLQALEPFTKIRPAAEEISGFLTGHPTWTGTAAIPLARSTALPANAIAQLVQKSGVGEGNEGRANYLKAKDLAMGTMRQFGLLPQGMKEGGLLQAAGRSSASAMKNLWSGIGPAGLQSGIRNIAAYVMKQYPGLEVTSTTGGTHATNSLHYTGQAVDLASGDYGYMDKAAGWIKSSGLYKALAEGIHNPNLSVDEGRLVDPSFYAEVWGDHRNHIHLGVTHPWSASTFEGAGEAGGGAGPAGKPKEKIPPSYKGAKTGPLGLGAMPRSLPEVEREISKLEKMRPTYKRARAEAEKAGKPGTAQAIGKNVTVIENRLAGLRSLRTRLKMTKARKALSKRVGRALRRFEGYDQIIEGSKHLYEKAAQDAEQVVDLEPQSPELTQNKGESEAAFEKRREEADTAYVAEYTSYVEGRERPAFGGVLARVADWRNNILRAEKYGFGKHKPSLVGSETVWEGEIRKARSRIDQINDFTQKVAERIAKWHHDHPKKAFPQWLKEQIAQRDEWRKELPFLQLRDSRLSGVLKEARERFFPGGDNRLTPPPTPLPGSGEFENQLTEIQGIHYPEQHELLGGDALAPPRQAGRFGGVIWDLQGTIEDLGLKIRQATSGLGSGLGGGGGEEGQSERSQYLEELLRQANQRTAVSEGQRKTIGEFEAVYPPYAGKAHSGAIVPGPASQERTMIVKGREGIFTEEQMAALGIEGAGTPEGPAGGVEVHVHGTIVSDHPNPVEVVIGDRRFTKAVTKVVRDGRFTGQGVR